MNAKGTTQKNQEKNINLIDQQKLIIKAEEIKKDLKASTWRDLEVGHKFTTDDKLSFITEDMLIVGCDIGSETHYIRAIDSRGREIGRKAFSFSNSQEGFAFAKDWMLMTAASH